MPCDYNNYPKNWKTEIRPAILERDGHKCKFCGVPNNAIIERTGPLKEHWKFWPEGMLSEAYSIDGHKSVKIVLTIMHLDHDTTNNNYDNLASGCQKCHLNYDKNHHKKNSRQTLIKKKKLQSLF